MPHCHNASLASTPDAAKKVEASEAVHAYSLSVDALTLIAPMRNKVRMRINESMGRKVVDAFFRVATAREDEAVTLQAATYRVTLVVTDLGWVDFDLGVPSSC